MPFSRYQRTQLLDFGRQYGTGRAHEVIRASVADGTLPCQVIVLKEAQRLDHLAGQFYGNGRYGWIIAAASNIGWMLQVPAGTLIRVPNFEDVASLVA